MNYLDLLNDDLLDKILGFVTDDIEKDFIITTNKIIGLNNKLRHLNINISYLDKDNPKYLSINYGYVTYEMDEYLYNNFRVKGDIIFISHLIEYFGSPYGSQFVSKKINNPTYLDIMISANNSIKKTGDYDHHFNYK